MGDSILAETNELIMSDFNTAFKKTMGHEGGYASDPDDLGGETYKGISRRFHPSWEGWDTIDNHQNTVRDMSSFDAALKSDNALQIMVGHFYQDHYWDRFQGNQIPDQDIANELFDTGVNMGIDRAVEFLQDALNLFNKQETLYLDIAVDGKLGPGTMAALDSAIRRGRKFHVLKDMNVQQGQHYRTRMKQNPTQEKFGLGWYNRVEISKT